MTEPGTGIAAFLRGADAGSDDERLALPHWQRPDWEALFSHAERVEVPRGGVLIHRDAAERTLYFVASGLLQVDSSAVSPSVTVHPGSVVGELSFLDGRPRAATVSAVADSAVHRLSLRGFEAFADEHPRKACDLGLALGRVVALRLRRTLSSGPL